MPNKTLETPNYKLERLKHDDPRLDNIEASYKMADEMEDPTGVTRRSQEPTNKQTPIIKGVLPDAPAPISVPKPEMVKPHAAAPRPAPVPVPVAVVAAPAEKGFFGWIKNLFVAAPDVAPAAPSTGISNKARPDEQKPRDGAGRDAGRDRPRDGAREGRPEGRGEARDGNRSEGRGNRGGRGGRPERGERGARGERPASNPQRERLDADGKFLPNDDNLSPHVNLSGPSTDRDASAGAQGAPREPRSDRGPRNSDRADRTDRGERPERGGRGRNPDRNVDRGSERIEGRSDAGTDASANPSQPERELRADARPDHRGERRPDRNARPPETQNGATPAVGTGDESQAGNNGTTGRNPNPGDGTNEDGPPREKRSRDRHGRERSPRGDRGDRQDQTPRDPQQALDGFAENPGRAARAEVASAPQETPAHGTSSYFTARPDPVMADRVEPATPVPMAIVTPAVPAVVEKPAAVIAAPVVAASPAATLAAASTGLPKVQNFLLPVETLSQVAQSSGLSWVNSDSAKVASVQAAIAAEVKPIHVPRERPAPAQMDVESLVLVETKRDLRSMQLPFEETQPQ